MTILWLEPVRRGRRHVVLRYGVDDICFATTYWYDDVDFDALEAHYGADLLRMVEFHLLAFEANKAASLAPTAFDPGPYTDLVTEAFWDLWETMFHRVWGVWRYENGLPHYRLPRPVRFADARPAAAAAIGDPCGRVLLLCGGGKDSLASMKLLERAGIAYDTFAYAHSTYGPAALQHDLIEGLVRHCTPHQRHHGWVVDDAMDAPIAAAYPELGIGHIVAAETVSSYWTALPVALAHGFIEVALGITRSTDEHNLVWTETGEEINYLWGMSGEAERLLHDYIYQHLVADLRMFHLLRPVYDVNVFALLQRDLDAVPGTHSCAKQKPWCGRCAKCLYVWMSYVAWLPAETVDETFTVNLFDIADNRTMLRKMLGLESHKPTDCIGTVSEARLAFAMCRAKGVGGLIADDIDADALGREAEATLRRYAAVSAPGRTLPDRLVDVLDGQFRRQADATAAYAHEVLGVTALR